MKSEFVWAFVFMMMLCGSIFLAFYDYFTTPSFRILPWIFIIFYGFYNFFIKFGEYLGNFVQGLAKKNFVTMGGMLGVYESHEEHHSGMVTYFFSTYSRYLRHCKDDEYIEVGAFKRFLLMFTPTKVSKITDYKEMFMELPMSHSDTPEGTIFYLGTKRGVRVNFVEEVLQMRLKKALATISEITTITESALASSEASAQGENRKMVQYTTQVSQAIANMSKHEKQQQVVEVQRQQ